MLPPPSQQIRVLADGDAFYASCEVARRPELRGKIVIVQRLDMCLAVTYPGKKLWLWLSTPMREVRKILQWVEHYIFEADMGYYERVSNTVFEILANHANTREQFSVDESFYDRTGLVANNEQAVKDYALQLQEYILQATWMPISFGFGRTRLVAKIFNKFRKPYGVYGHLEQLSIAQALKPLALQSIPFIGRKRASKIQYCNTVGDFMSMNRRTVRDRLHWDGLKLWLELHGHNALSILRKWWPSCIWRSRSFHPHFTSCKKTLWRKLMMNFEKAYAQMVVESVATRYLWIMFRDKNFAHYPLKQRLKDHTYERTELIQAMKDMFEQLYRPWVLYRTTAIYFAELVVVAHRQESLFDFDHTRRQKEHHQRKIVETIATINHRLWWTHITTGTNAEAIKKMDGSEFQKMKVL
jgi:DNA polymerase-4/DNA polymerase V